MERALGEGPLLNCPCIFEKIVYSINQSPSFPDDGKAGGEIKYMQSRRMCVKCQPDRELPAGRKGGCPLRYMGRIPLQPGINQRSLSFGCAQPPVSLRKSGCGGVWKRPAHDVTVKNYLRLWYERSAKEVIFLIGEKTMFARSLQEFKKTRTITMCAMLGAAAMVLGTLSIEVIPSVRIGFSGIPNEFVAWLFGPAVGMFFNGILDVFKFFVKPSSSGFFPGLTLVTMLAGLIYGFFFYGKPLRLWRILAAKLTVALICNVILNTYCLSILLGQDFWLILPARIVKNLIMWPVDSLIFFYTAKMLETAGLFRLFHQRAS